MRLAGGGAELFTTRVRSGGFSIGYNFSVAIFGGTAPYVATFLVARTGNPLRPPTTSYLPPCSPAPS